MPTYDYLCDQCGHAFEQLESITAKPKKKCPACRKNTLKRLIGTGSGIIFKGSGFYETDYKNKTGGAQQPKKSEDKSAKSEDSSTSSSKSEDSTADKKTAAKTDKKSA